MENNISLLDIVDKAEYIKVQVIDGKFQIRENFVQNWLKKKANVIAIDELTGDKTLLTPFEFACDPVSNNIKKRTYQGGYATTLTFDWYPMDSALPDTETSKWSEALLKRFHWTYFNLFREYLISDEFRTLNNQANNVERKTKQVYPAKENVYRAFSYRSDVLRVLFLGYDPYLNNHATGHAFATEQSTKPVSLKEIQEAIRFELGYDETWKLQNNLEHMISQGCMFLNSSLTGTQKAGMYSELWQPFTSKVLKTLSKECKPLLFILTGRNAQEFEHCIDSEKHTILKCEHPAAASYKQRSWNSANIFKNINNKLQELGTPILKW